MDTLTHLSPTGEATMVDVSEKPETLRVAVARGEIRMKRETFTLIKEGQMKKGDVLGTARIAGIMAAKQTPRLIPLCHPIPISKISVEFTLDEEKATITATAEVKNRGATGVEMEALTAVTISLLTIYDMGKAVDRGMVMGDIHLVRKSGGKSGTYVYEGS
ncbi:MAG: cyclic pyranopterin monophosphate synthase MoaC [Deltaproteobacteria bacterium]|nr:MAG: cyclic pyranopterin monophosphate synthase MoaC [Deltaproteobacteria bacterium]